MKICSCCGFKLLDNQKYCPRCGLPISSKPLADTSEKITSDDEKAEVKTQPKLNISDGNKKKHISKSIIIIITIIILGAFLLLSITLNKETNISNKETDEVKEEDRQKLMSLLKEKLPAERLPKLIYVADEEKLYFKGLWLMVLDEWKQK